MPGPSLATVRQSALRVACITLACAACTHPAATPRPVTGLPDQFVIDGAVPAGTARTCFVHLKSPVDDTRLTLLSSVDHGSAGLFGDYRVDPAGRYGIAAGERLRVDCLTNRASGAVRARG